MLDCLWDCGHDRLFPLLSTPDFGEYVLALTRLYVPSLTIQTPTGTN